MKMNYITVSFPMPALKVFIPNRGTMLAIVQKSCTLEFLDAHDNLPQTW